jgi:hypothetical protein
MRTNANWTDSILDPTQARFNLAGHAKMDQLTLPFSDIAEHREVTHSQSNRSRSQGMLATKNERDREDGSDSRTTVTNGCAWC